MISEFTKYNNIHFIGIGGIGISALARMMLEEGKKVSGSDNSDSLITRELSGLGAIIYKGHKTENISPHTDLVIYTVAIPDSNPELEKARERGIFCLTYPEALGLISRGKFTIAIAGTHGKTTTTAMVAGIFIEAEKDPTVIVGSLLSKTHSNLVTGHSQYFIVEACEYKRSFLNLSPKILVITNIDDDHLDYYGNLEGVQKAFREMIDKLPSNGLLITDTTDAKISPVLESLKCRVVDYKSLDFKGLALKVPGEHNRRNAQAALAVAIEVEIPREFALEALNQFQGTWRRFEYKGTTSQGSLVYDDYGHHPTEVRATLAGARERYPNSKINLIFQPHLYSRTKEHLEDFATAFANTDNLYLVPIYAARESFDPSISSEILASKVKGVSGVVKIFPDLSAVTSYVLENTKDNEVIITMGAGDIYTMAEDLVHAPK